MAIQKSATDKFANMATISVVESAANTLTFKKLETGISLSEKVAWVIHRIHYTVASLEAAVFNGDTDTLFFGIGVNNTWSGTPAIDEPTIIDYNAVSRLDFGAAASGGLVKARPWIERDFMGLPGGGLIVPPVPLFLYAKGNGLVSAETVTCRIWYTLLQLSTEDYWELVEARRVIQS